MANPERRGPLETVIHYNNYVDIGYIVVGGITGNIPLILVGVAGLAGGKFAENWLRNRRQKQYS